MGYYYNTAFKTEFISLWTLNIKLMVKIGFGSIVYSHCRIESKETQGIIKPSGHVLKLL